VQLSMDPNVPGQCLQQASSGGGPLTTYPTFVPVREGDHIQWTSTFTGHVNVVFFASSQSPDYPNTPMFTSTGNWVRQFMSGNNPADTSAKLTSAEAAGGNGYNFSYTQVIVQDPSTHQSTACRYPDPVQGMGIHIDR